MPKKKKAPKKERLLTEDELFNVIIKARKFTADFFKELFEVDRKPKGDKNG